MTSFLILHTRLDSTYHYSSILDVRVDMTSLLDLTYTPRQYTPSLSYLTDTRRYDITPKILHTILHARLDITFP